MRFLIVCDFSLTYVGGAQTALIRQAEALLTAGHEVAVLAHGARGVKFSPEIKIINAPNVRVFRPIEIPMWRKTADLTKRVAEIFDELQPDAVLTHSEFALTTTAVDEAKNRGIANLHTVHTFFWAAPLISAPLSPVARLIFRSITGRTATKAKLTNRPMDNALRNMTLKACLEADVTISPSAHQGEKLKKAGVETVTVISNVTETTGKPSPLPQAEKLKLAWISRFAPEKRLEVATKAVELANLETNGGIELHIAGGPAEEGNEHIWHGKLSAAQVSDLITNSHALLLTSLGFDNQPMVILEAFAHGRPVVLIDPVLGKEFGEAAMLSKTPEAEGLAKELVRIANNRDELTKRAAAATEAAKLSTAKTHAEKILKQVELASAKKAR